MAIAHLDNRALLYLHGTDARSFLQGLISNDVNLCTSNQAVYAALLTPQGKFLHDLFIYQAADGLLIDAENARLEDLQARLLRYKLRAKISLDIVPDQGVYAIWQETTPLPQTAVADPRLAALGYRVIASNLPTTASFKDYDRHRIQLGVADGSRELQIEKSTLQEGNFDLLNGISFNKGCYMGQELTARIHYRGLVKKRLLPISFTSSAPPTNTTILQGEKMIGEVRSSLENHALGLIECSVATVENVKITANGMEGILHIPEWFSPKT